MSRSKLLTIVILLGMLGSLQIVASPMNMAMSDSHSGIVADYDAHGPIAISSNEDFSSQGWPGSGTLEDPYVIEGLFINASRGQDCIKVRNTRMHFTVTNCFFGHYGYDNEWPGGTHASVGARLFNNTHGMVENNSFIGNGVGVYIIMSNNTMIRDNIFSGIFDDPIISAISSHVTISNNICAGNSFSINVADYAWDEHESYDGIYDDITIIDNVCNANLIGIVIGGCMSGIIANNTAFDNDGYWDSDYWGATTLGSNFLIHDSQNLLFTNNTGVAKGVCISVRDSLNISIVLNSFVSHEFHPAYDESKLAFFDYNYYSNYDGIDENGDGIGDTPYFDLYGNIQDEHPLMYWPWAKPLPTATATIVITLIVIGGVCGLIVLIVVIKRR